MICKYYLTLGSETSDLNSPQCIEVSSMISNLDDVELSHSRVGLNGVVRKIGSKVDFVGEARDRLVDMYLTDQLASSAAFAVYRIENDWTFTKFFECPLDFSTFHFNIHTATCSMLDSTAAAIVKAKKSVKYELSVSDLKDAKPFLYDGLKILNDTTYQIIGLEVEGSTYMEVDVPGDAWWWYPRLGIINSNLINNESIIVTDQEEEFQKNGSDCGEGFPAPNVNTSFFVECIKDCTITIDFSTFNVKQGLSMAYVLCKINGSEFTPLTCSYSNLKAKDDRTAIGALKWSGMLLEGEKLQLAVLNHDRLEGLASQYLRIVPQDGIVKWNERSVPVNIDVVTPHKLLEEILRDMSGDGERIYAAIKGTYPVYSETGGKYVEVENGRLKNTLLAASDSIRNIPDAKINTSFSDFCKFMETCFGYVYDIRLMPKSGEERLEDILARSRQFKNFTDAGVNTERVEGPHVSVFFSTTTNTFVGIERFNEQNPTAYLFPGSEEYQTYDEAHGYKVNTERVYFSTEKNLFYSVTALQQPDEASPGTWHWVNQLEELVVENLNRDEYVDVKQFGAIIPSFYTDHGTYSGPFDASCVTFVTEKKSFYYRSEDMYYSSFPNSTDYNLSDRARADMLFQKGEQLYFMFGDALTKCTLAAGPAELVPFVYFSHRDEVFTSKGVHNIKVISDFEYEVSDRLYSQIVIGYNKRDYDIGNNGADEFNFNVTYLIDQKLSDKKLSLISPYRTDSYGIEELAEKRGEETSSTGSDKQIFAVFCFEDQTDYKPDRTLPIENVATDTMFNAQLSPRYCVMANERYLASFSPLLKFASSEGFANVVIGGVRASADVTVNRPLLGNGDITFSTNQFVMPEDWNGYVVQIESDGRTYRGYLRSLDLAADESEVLKYKLIESR